MSDRSTDTGLVDDLEAEIYHRTWDEYSATDLKNILRSPARMTAGRAGLLAPSDAMKRGTLTHLLTFEPDRFEAQYVIAPPGMVRNKKHEKYQNFLELEACGREVLLEKDMEVAGQVALAAGTHPFFARVRKDRERFVERSFWWLDEDTGIPCKCRPDEMIDIGDRWCLLDLKTTRNSSPEAFARQSLNLKYHLQAAHYCNGVEAVTGKPCDFVIVAVENQPPYEVNTYRYCRVGELTDQHKLGIQERSEALSKLTVCRGYNTYPNASENKVVELDVPAWALRDLDEPFDVDMEDDDA